MAQVENGGVEELVVGWKEAMLLPASADLNVCHWAWLNHIRPVFADQQKEGAAKVESPAWVANEMIVVYL